MEPIKKLPVVCTQSISPLWLIAERCPAYKRHSSYLSLACALTSWLQSPFWLFSSKCWNIQGFTLSNLLCPIYTFWPVTSFSPESSCIVYSPPAPFSHMHYSHPATWYLFIKTLTKNLLPNSNFPYLPGCLSPRPRLGFLLFFPTFIQSISKNLFLSPKRSPVPLLLHIFIAKSSSPIHQTSFLIQHAASTFAHLEIVLCITTGETLLKYK